MALGPPVSLRGGPNKDIVPADNHSARAVGGARSGYVIDVVSQWPTVFRVRFEWDAKKERQNVNKHGVSFREAKALFTSNVDVLEIYDAVHSHLEERFIAIGPIRRGLVLVVFTERSEDTIRIISARWASKTEQALYFEHMEKDT